MRPPTGPDDFERDWLGAAFVDPRGRDATRRHVPDRSIRRRAVSLLSGNCFSLGRWSRTNSAHCRRAPGGRQLGAPAQQQLFGYYDAAIGHDETTAEARIRKAWLLRRLGRDGDARAQLDLLGG